MSLVHHVASKIDVLCMFGKAEYNKSMQRGLIDLQAVQPAPY